MLLKNLIIRQKKNNKVALKYRSTTVTYKDLYDTVVKKSEIIGKISNNTKNIGIFLPNSIDYIIAYFSIMFIDKVAVPIDIQSKIKEIVSIIEYCDLDIIITNSDFKVLLSELVPNNKPIFIYDINNDINNDILNNIRKLNPTNTLLANDEDSVAVMLHTSGTTSCPKRVMLTHRNLISNIESNIQSLDLNNNDITLIALPMFFGYCNTAQLLTHIYLGAKIVIMDETFMPNKFFRMVQDDKITNFTGVPSMLYILRSYRYRHNYNISSLKYICFGGSSLPAEKIIDLIQQFPTIGFIQTYGQTEASPRITCLLPQDSYEKVGSVGKAIPNVDIRIVNENNIDVETNEIGEIIVRGPNVMKGYYKRPDETEKVLKSGWLYTGDLGEFDIDGYLYLTGRKKNIIISGGLNIYPEEIEEILLQHDKVNEVIVIGQEHSSLGEIPIAKVVLKDSKNHITENELRNYCFERISRYKVPFKIEFVNNIKKTATGKIKRRNVEE